jgi:O-antigen ligase
MPKLPSITIEKSYVLFLIVSPFIFFKCFSDPSQTPVFLFLNLLYLSLQLFIPMSRHSDKKDLGQLNSFIIILTLLLALFCIGIISTIYNGSNTESFYELARTASIIIFFANNALVLQRRQNSFNSLVWGLAACSFIYLCIAMYEALSMGRAFFDTQQSYQVTAHLGHRNLMANFLALSMPLYVYIINISHSRIIKAIVGLILLIITLFLILLASRVGWAGLIAFMVVSGAWTISRYRQISLKKNLWPSLVTITLVGLIVGLVLADPHLSLNMRRKVQSMTELKRDVNENSYTLNERLSLWRVSLLMAEAHPLIGVGPGLWKFNYAFKDLQGTQAQSGRVLFQRPHNDLLWYLCEYGIVGLVVFLAIIALVLFYSIRQLYSDTWLKAYLAAAGILIFVVICFFDFPKERPVHLLLLSFYLAVFAVSIDSLPVPRFITSFLDSRYRIIIFILSCCTCLFLSVRTMGEYYLNQALADRLTHQSTEMKRHFMKTILTWLFII